jgi:hypothetical protein
MGFLIGAGVLFGVLGGCPPVTPPSDDGDGDGHANVPLLDVDGNPLTASSTKPFSSRQTCGACHDVDAIADGYHFQQGRIDADGDVQVRDNFFNDGRAYVRSDGMFGKW